MHTTTIQPEPIIIRHKHKVGDLLQVTDACGGWKTMGTIAEVLIRNSVPAYRLDCDLFRSVKSVDARYATMYRSIPPCPDHKFQIGDIVALCEIPLFVVKDVVYHDMHEWCYAGFYVDGDGNPRHEDLCHWRIERIERESYNWWSKWTPPPKRTTQTFTVTIEVDERKKFGSWFGPFDIKQAIHQTYPDTCGCSNATITVKEEK